jgi:hypothetical protein
VRRRDLIRAALAGLLILLGGRSRRLAAEDCLDLARGLGTDLWLEGPGLPRMCWRRGDPGLRRVLGLAGCLNDRPFRGFPARSLLFDVEDRAGRVVGVFRPAPTALSAQFLPARDFAGLAGG